MLPDVLKYWLSKVAAAMLQIVLPPIAVSQIGVAGFARYALVLQAGALLRIVLIEPFVQYAVRDYTSYPAGRAAIAMQTYGVFLLLAASIYPPVWFFSDDIGKLVGLSSIDISLAYLYGVTLSAFTLGICFTMAERRMGRLWAVELGSSILIVASAIVAGMVFPSPAAYVLSACSAMIVLLPLLYRPHLSRRLPLLEGIYIRRALSFGGPLLVSAILSWIVAVIDRFQISAALGLEAAGSYVAAYQLLVQSMNLLTAPIFVALHPFVYQSAEAEIVAPLRRLIKWLALISFLYLGAAVFGARYVIGLVFGSRISVGEDVILWLALAGVLVPFGQIMLLIAKVERKTALVQYVTLVSALIVVLGNAWALPRYGVVAAAITTVLAYAFQVAGIAAFCPLALRIVGLSARWRRGFSS